MFCLIKAVVMYSGDDYSRMSGVVSMLARTEFCLLFANSVCSSSIPGTSQLTEDRTSMTSAHPPCR